MNVKPYDISRGEKVDYGYQAALELIFRQYLDVLEVQFYDRFNRVFEFDYNIQPGIKFQNYLKSLPSPVPIFLFGLTPLHGESLLVMENSWCNLFLDKRNATAQNTILQNDSFAITAENARFMGEIAHQVIQGFCSCWEKIQPVKGKLKKLVSNRVKAKVMDTTEICVPIKVSARYENFKALCQFCFSSYQLDPIMKTYWHKALILGEATRKERRIDRAKIRNLFAFEAVYELSGELGKMNLSQSELLKSLRQGEVLPIDNRINSNVMVKINDIPILSADPGVTNENWSLKINGRFDSVEKKIKIRPKPFSKLTFPHS